MRKPFTDSIIGSWLFIRSTDPEFYPGLIHHFTKDLKDISDIPLEGKRFRHSMPYSISGSVLTLFPPESPSKDFILSHEDDGSICVSREGSSTWWMQRLTTPEPDSLGFVDDDGLFKTAEDRTSASSQ
jgi:hypothetical protein